MEEFKKDLLKVCGKNTAALIIFFVLGGVFLAFGLLMWITAYDPFDAQTDGYATMEVTYVMGPFAELTSDGKDHTEFYIAEDSEGYWSIIATKGETSLPVYGVDVDDTVLDSLPAHTIRGKSTSMPPQAAHYLVDYLSDTGLDITTYNYDEYFGDHYLDTTHTAVENSIVLYVIAAVFTVLGIIIFSAGGNKKKAVKKKIALLEQNGGLQRIYSDFASSPRNFSPKLGVAVSNHFILDYNNTKEGFYVTPLDDITNVFKCNMLNGDPTTTSYIALETADGKRTLVAAHSGKSKDFDQVLNQLKANIHQGGVMTW